MRRTPAFLANCSLALLAAMAGCTSNDTTTDDEVGDSTESTDDGTESSDSSSTTDTESTDDATDDATETGGGTCGDGVVDPGEECDDENTVDGDGCSATCMISACGLTWQWMETIAGGTPAGYGVATDAAGNVVAAGEDESGAAWVAKWSPDGMLAWEQSYGDGPISDLVLDADGDIYVVGTLAGMDDDDIWYARLSGTDGSEAWSQIEASAAGDDVGTGIALAEDGSVVVAGRVRVGDGDDDVWVSMRSADDGSETWASTWSGTGDGTFSTDRSSQLVITADGAIWVGAREHVDFDTQEATLLKFDEAGMMVDSFQPQGDGSTHQHESWLLATDGTNIYYLITKFQFPYRSWLYKLDGTGTELWSKTEADWLVETIEEGVDWAIEGLDVGPEGNLLIGGDFANDDPDEGINWGEAWTAQLDGNGDFVCRSTYKVDDGDIIPPSLNIVAAGGSAAGIAVTGVVSDNPDNSLWTAFFQL